MLCVFEKHQQLIHRHAPAFIRHVLETFRQGALTATQAARQLSLSPSRLYALATAYRLARSKKLAPLWTPGASGGDHAAAWPQPVLDLLRKRLACQPPCPYSFAASEALRLHAFKLDRAQVRRWALENKLAHAVPPKKVLAPVRRWQRAQIGELWQLDASPHRWFPPSNISYPMLNMLDDCSRLFTGSKLYEIVQNSCHGDRITLAPICSKKSQAFRVLQSPLQTQIHWLEMRTALSAGERMQAGHE